MSLTTDPNDPRLVHSVDSEPRQQNDTYLVLSEEERSKGFVRPFRDTYIHDRCGTETRMVIAIAETYARNPYFYGGTYCCSCRKHLPLDEFKWLDGEVVGS